MPLRQFRGDKHRVPQSPPGDGPLPLFSRSAEEFFYGFAVAAPARVFLGWVAGSCVHCV
jgi:hypothetical protein